MIPAMAELLVVHARIATLRGGRYSMIEDGALHASDGRITWVGPAKEARPHREAEVVDAKGALVTPGLVACHTHLVYAGHPAIEQQQRLNGESYADITRI